MADYSTNASAPRLSYWLLPRHSKGLRSSVTSTHWLKGGNVCQIQAEGERRRYILHCMRCMSRWLWQKRHCWGGYVARQFSGSIEHIEIELDERRSGKTRTQDYWICGRVGNRVAGLFIHTCVVCGQERPIDWGWIACWHLHDCAGVSTFLVSDVVTIRAVRNLQCLKTLTTDSPLGEITCRTGLNSRFPSDLA